MNKIEEIQLSLKSLIFTREKFGQAELEVENALDNFFECESKDQVRIGLEKLVNLCDRHREVSKKFAFDSRTLLVSVERLTEVERSENIDSLSSVLSSLEEMELSNESLCRKFSQIREIVIEIFNEKNK